MATKKFEAHSIIFADPEPDPVIEGETVHPCTHSWDGAHMQTVIKSLTFEGHLIVTALPCSWCGAMHIAYNMVPEGRRR